MTLDQIITVGIAIGVPLAVSAVLVWYHTKRAQEILVQLAGVDRSHADSIRSLELAQTKMQAELDGVAARISVQLDALQQAITNLNQRMNATSSGGKGQN